MWSSLAFLWQRTFLFAGLNNQLKAKWSTWTFWTTWTPAQQPPVSMTLARHGGAAFAYEEIQIGAAVGLQHVVVIELIVTSLQRRLRRLPFCAATLDLRIADVEMQPACGHVQFDRVSALDQGQNSAGCGFGGNVQHDCSIGGAAHAGVRDAHYILHALLKNPGRQRHVANFGHSRIAARTAVLEHHDTAGIDVQGGIINAGIEIFDVLEDDGAPAMLHQ